MNKTCFLHGKERLARILAIGGVLVALGFAGDKNPPPTRTLLQPESPGVPVIGLRYFRLEPSGPDTTFRLLVIPVQFPEDGVLGGGSEAQILEKLNGSDAHELAGYYAHETVGRLDIISTLAPIVIAPHPRSYYTTEGGAFGTNGLDPRTYPHNGQGLVDDVTRTLTDRVDFRIYDNTEDGIVDGLLILHSGPESAETFAGALVPEVLVAHAFTLPAQAPRGGSIVFPYALAATRDGIGVWAHEVGHLFGLPDLYVANSVCFGPGLGEWSLMATGANRGGADNPTGLDAFSLQLLGIAPQFDDGNGVTLGQGVFARASDPGEENGPRYYLVDYREAGDGPAGSTPARIIYLVNEDAVDNRSCSNPPESYRPLVRVAQVVCPADTACTQTFYQSCDLCPNVGFTFSGTTVHVQSGALPPVVVSRVQLGPPQMGSGGTEAQRVYLSFRNVDTGGAQSVTIGVTPLNPDSVCMAGPSSWDMTLAPGSTDVDSSLALTPCSGSGSLSGQNLTVVLQITRGLAWSHEDTLLLPADHVGLSWFNDRCGFQTTGSWIELKSLAPCPPVCCQVQGFKALFPPLAYGELLSPWFSIPVGGNLNLSHAWDMTALSPDVALDAGQIHLQFSNGTTISLEPQLGWGYTAERSVGNLLGGLVVLSGSGERWQQAFDLSVMSGDVARLVFTAAGDASADEGSWLINGVNVTSGPGISFSLEWRGSYGSDPTLIVAKTMSSALAGVSLTLFRGLPGVVPQDTAFAGLWDGEPRMVLGHFEGPKSRFELVWSDSTGHAASTAAIFDLPVPPAPHFLLAPSPNPVHHGDNQNWSIRIADDDPPGTYVVRLVRLDGGLVFEQSLRIDVPGTRLIPWNGLDGEGRTIPNGIYFLEARRPDGVRNGQRIVVLP